MWEPERYFPSCAHANRECYDESGRRMFSGPSTGGHNAGATRSAKVTTQERERLMNGKCMPSMVFLASLILSNVCGGANADKVQIDCGDLKEPVSPYVYGQFIEHLGRCIYGGIWAEMLEDRKFYFPVDGKRSG